jgi:hypothetical protein
VSYLRKTDDPLRRVSSTSRRVSEEPPLIPPTLTLTALVRCTLLRRQSACWMRKQPQHDKHSRAHVNAEVTFYLYDPHRILEGIVDPSESSTTATTSFDLQQSRRRPNARYVDCSASQAVGGTFYQRRRRVRSHISLSSETMR